MDNFEILEQDPKLRVNTKYLRSIILGVAILFIALGLGNYSYGYVKGEYYAKLQSKIGQEELARSARNKIPFLADDVRIDVKSEYFQRLRARIDFYQVVRIGGVCFICFSLAGLALWLFLLNSEEFA